jgi:hypothetical protein
MFTVFYEKTKREPNIIRINECRCDERQRAEAYFDDFNCKNKKGEPED